MLSFLSGKLTENKEALQEALASAGETPGVADFSVMCYGLPSFTKKDTGGCAG